VSDAETLAVYQEKAREYATMVGGQHGNPQLLEFLSLVPDAGRILDLGCGPGASAAIMVARGFEVDAVDASPAMAAEAARLYDLAVRVATFDDIEGTARYDGIWASFSLLHAARSDFPRHLGALHRAMRPKGVLSIGMKTGQGAQRDALGRWYTYYSVPALQRALTDAGFAIHGSSTGRDKGLSGEWSPWVQIIARA